MRSWVALGWVPAGRYGLLRRLDVAGLWAASAGLHACRLVLLAVLRVASTVGPAAVRLAELVTSRIGQLDLVMDPMPAPAPADREGQTGGDRRVVIGEVVAVHTVKEQRP